MLHNERLVHARLQTLRRGRVAQREFRVDDRRSAHTHQRTGRLREVPRALPELSEAKSSQLANAIKSATQLRSSVSASHSECRICPCTDWRCPSSCSCSSVSHPPMIAEQARRTCHSSWYSCEQMCSSSRNLCPKGRRERGHRPHLGALLRLRCQRNQSPRIAPTARVSASPLPEPEHRTSPRRRRPTNSQHRPKSAQPCAAGWVRSG